MKKLMLILPIFVVLVTFTGCREPEIEKSNEYIERGRIYTVIPATEFWATNSTGEGAFELKDDKNASEAARRAKVRGDHAFTGREVIERRKTSNTDEEFLRVRTREVDLQEAAQNYILAYDLGWSDYMLVFRIGWCLQRLDPAKAAKYFHMSNEMYKADNKGKIFYDALFSEAASLMITGKYLDEREYAEEFSEVNYKLFKDDDNKGKTNADKIMVKKGAISLFTELIKNQPDYRLAYYNRAISYYTVGMYQDAYDDISKFLKMSRKADVYTTYGKELSLLCKHELRIRLG